ncbi:MAG: hypothetical protein U5R48_13210 [Gammaproteobacteria bacterium]|nr:hypothetical protein [Gammaproteobacteria bacterium]
MATVIMGTSITTRSTTRSTSKKHDDQHGKHHNDKHDKKHGKHHDDKHTTEKHGEKHGKKHDEKDDKRGRHLIFRPRFFRPRSPELHDQRTMKRDPQGSFFMSTREPATDAFGRPWPLVNPIHSVAMTSRTKKQQHHVGRARDRPTTGSADLFVHALALGVRSRQGAFPQA